MHSPDSDPIAAKTAADVCHRAKNDLQTVANLLALAAPHANSPTELASILEPRVLAMSIPYSLMAQSGAPSTLKDIAQRVVRLAWQGGVNGFPCVIEAAGRSVNLRVAGPLCLWLFEACAAVFGQAFRGESSPEVNLRLNFEQGYFLVELSVGGHYFSTDVIQELEQGLGFKIARAIAEVDFKGELLFDHMGEMVKIGLKSPEEEFQRLNGE